MLGFNVNIDAWCRNVEFEFGSKKILIAQKNLILMCLAALRSLKIHPLSCHCVNSASLRYISNDIVIGGEGSSASESAIVSESALVSSMETRPLKPLLKPLLDRIEKEKWG